MPEPSNLEIVPLGGLGEFGLNMMVYRWGNDCLIVDAGMMFPAGHLLGVDFVVPDLSFLEHAGRIHGVVLTHAHEDHIGAVPHLLRRHDVPVWGTDYTLELLRRRLIQREFKGNADLRRLPDSPQSVTVGPFAVEAIAVAHSVPQSRLLAIETPVGKIVHSGDFKLDPDPPDGEGTDLERLQQLGADGVLALLSDSTNATWPGETPGEATVEPALDEIFEQVGGRIVLTSFASNVQRLATLGRLARRHGRRLALLGAAVNLHAEIAQQLGLINSPAGVRIAGEKLATLPPSTVLAVAGGSQGEALSAMSRIAAGQHRDIRLEPGDTVIHSARVIPGNEKPIALLIDRLLRLGVRVVGAADAAVHVSGHASRGELQRLIEMLEPRWFVPVHGEYHQLRTHLQLAEAAGIEPQRTLLAEDGDRIEVGPDTFRIAGRVDVGRTFMESPGDEVSREHIRERRKSANDGVVVAVVDIDTRTGSPRGYPDVVARGFTPDLDNGSEMLEQAREAIMKALEEAPNKERGDAEALGTRIELHLRRAIRRTVSRKPLVLALVRFHG